MINLALFQSSFLLDWGERLLKTEEEDWKLLALEALGAVGGRAAFHSNVGSGKFKGMHLIKNAFWRKVLSSWLDSDFVRDEPNAEILTKHSSLFNNKDITYKNSTLFFPECISKNIVYVKDVLINGAFITYHAFKEIIKTPNALLIYHCLYNALIKVFPSFFHNSDTANGRGSEQCNNKVEVVNHIGRKSFYKILNKHEPSYIETYLL